MFKLNRNHFQLINLFEIRLYHAICSAAEKKLRSASISPKPLPLFDIKYKNAIFCRNRQFSSSSAKKIRGLVLRILKKRRIKRAKAAARVLNEALFHSTISQLPPRFDHEELHSVMVSLDDPVVCLEIFKWAGHQRRFMHNALTYHVTIKKLGAARMYEEMDDVVNQVLADPSIGSEALYNTMIYYFVKARKLSKAMDVFKHMHDRRKLDCRPSVRTYNILITALLDRRKNFVINNAYMENVRCLFKQMVDDGVEPDLYCLNSMIKGYVISNHVDDALRIFHQMGEVYNCQPNSYSYDYLIHGLCVQGRTDNAREFCDRMKQSGLVPSSKSYNSLVSSLALEGKVDDAVKFLWEMADNQRSADFIMYRTVINEVYRQKEFGDAVKLLKELHGKNHMDRFMHAELLSELENESRL